jgi:hypothetical protein
MPESTATPIALRSSAPAPVAIASGTTPSEKARDVITIGRSRSREASTAASAGGSPSASRWRANSTIRIAFLAARPISTMKPICVSTLLSPPTALTPSSAASTASGVIRMIAMGSAQLSYWADRNRKTNSTASTKA